MNSLARHIFPATLLFALLLVFSSLPAQQRINFGVHAGEGLEVDVQQPEVLDFGDRYSGEGSISITPWDESEGDVVPVRIYGVEYLDVTVTLTPPPGGKILLEGNTDPGDEQRSMPVNIMMAYFNTGPGGDVGENIETAKLAAQEVTGDMVTFQIRRRTGGPPGPPPTPPHSGYVPPMAVAYLFIYGDLTVGNVNAGPYSGEIIIDVEYSTYAFD